VSRLAKLTALAVGMAFSAATYPYTASKPVRCHRTATIGKPAARLHCIELRGKR
jgi:hypothetical protein